MVTGLQVRLASLDVCQYVGHLSIGFLAEHSGTDNLRVISSFGWGLISSSNVHIRTSVAHGKSWIHSRGVVSWISRLRFNCT